MKSSWLLIAFLFLGISHISALTFTVTVPEGTNECYIAGSFNGWSQQKMAKIGENKFQIEIDTQASSAKYKYCSGPGWEYVEKASSGQDIADRNYNENDVVQRWAAVYNPNETPGDITITANVPENTPDGEVYIVGSFVTPSWDPAAALKMTKLSATQYRLTIPNVTVIQYKLLSGRSWENEELTASGQPVENRNAEVSNPNVTITVERWRSTSAPSNDLVRHTFESFTPLQGSRRVVIYLPPDYETNTEKHYPVLYMHDAQNVFESGPFGSWNMASALQELYDQGKNVGIVVTIDNSAGRLKEYTPFGNSQYEGGVAQGDEYLQAIKNHIIPYVNANFRTLTDRENTGICGSSMGGLISYYAGLEEESVFGRIGVMSPSFWFCKNDLGSYVDNWTGSHTDGTKMHFICGDSESGSMVGDMQLFYNKTKSKGIPEENLKYEVVSGGTHSEGAWAAQIGRVYEFLFDGDISTGNDEVKTQNKTEIRTVDKVIHINNNTEQSVKLMIFNTSGQKVFENSFIGSVKSGKLDSGVYIAQFQFPGKSYSQKVIVN